MNYVGLLFSSILIIPLLLHGCFGGASGSGGTCEPNTPVQCMCLSGEMGYQLCNETGDGLEGSCDCSDFANQAGPGGLLLPPDDLGDDAGVEKEPSLADAAYQMAFNFADVDGNGYLSLPEWVAAGYDAMNFASADVNGDGEVSFEEYKFADLSQPVSGSGSGAGGGFIGEDGSCSNGSIGASCVESTDCNGGMCVGDTCTGLCEEDWDCWGEVCLEDYGFCVRDCVSSTDCCGDSVCESLMGFDFGEMICVPSS